MRTILWPGVEASLELDILSCYWSREGDPILKNEAGEVVGACRQRETEVPRGKSQHRPVANDARDETPPNG